MSHLDADTMELKVFFGQTQHGCEAISHVWDSMPTQEEKSKLASFEPESLVWHVNCGDAMIEESSEQTKMRQSKCAPIDFYGLSQSSGTTVSEVNYDIPQSHRHAATWCVCIMGVSRPEALEIAGWLIESCRFMKRWSTQDHIVPQRLLFYDQTGRVIKEKQLSDLKDEIPSRTTGTNRDTFQCDNRVYRVSSACPVVWAAGGRITKDSGNAYCLSCNGFFDISVCDRDASPAFCHSKGHTIGSPTSTPTLAPIWSRSSYRCTRSSPAECPHKLLPLSETPPFLALLVSYYKHILRNKGGQIGAAHFGGEPDSYSTLDPMSQMQALMPDSRLAHSSRSLQDTFVKTGLLRLLELNDKLKSSLSAIYPMHQPTPPTPWVSSRLPIFDLRTSSSQKFQRELDSIRLGASENDHIHSRDIKDTQFVPGIIPKIRGSDAETLFYADTSHFAREDGTGTGDGDDCSFPGSEEDELPFHPIRERFSWILDDLVEDCMHEFFQTSVQGLWGSLQVLQVTVADFLAGIQEGTKAQWDNTPCWPADSRTSGLYWVTGKAGCGKSTLMRHVASQIETSRTNADNAGNADIACLLGIPGLWISSLYSQKKRESQHPIGFSCLFYKRDPKRYESCRLVDVSNLPSLRQHLLKKHRQPPYCPTCFEVFRLVSERDQHVILRACTPAAAGHVEGISDCQVSRMRESCTDCTDEESWFRIWDIIFPEGRKPYSAYAEEPIDQLCLVFQRFWRLDGQWVLASLLQDTGFLAWDNPNEENDLAAIHSLVFTDVINAFLEPGTRILVGLKRLSQEHSTINGERLSESPEIIESGSAGTGVAAIRADKSLEGNRMIPTASNAPGQGDSTEGITPSDYNSQCIQPLLPRAEREGLASSPTSSITAEDDFPQHGRDSFKNFKNSNMMRKLSKRTGALPCEFAKRFNCKARYELEDLEGWIDHHRYEHLGGILPEKSSCWVCDETFSSTSGDNDIQKNFIARMRHISEHVGANGRWSNIVHDDKNMTEHLRIYKLLDVENRDEKNQLAESLRLARRLRGEDHNQMGDRTRRPPRVHAADPLSRRQSRPRTGPSGHDALEADGTSAHRAKKRRLNSVVRTGCLDQHPQSVGTYHLSRN